MKKAAFLRFSQGAMRGEVAIWFVGDDRDRYKIQTDTRICIDSRTSYLAPGQTLYVPKSSVVMALMRRGPSLSQLEAPLERGGSCR